MCHWCFVFLFITDNSKIPLFRLNPENYLADTLFSNAGTKFGSENIRNNENSYRSMPTPNDAITLKDLIHSFLLEFSPDAVSYLNDMTRLAEDIYSENVPMPNKRYPTTNMLQRREMKDHFRLSPLKHLMNSKILRINKRKKYVE